MKKGRNRKPRPSYNGAENGAKSYDQAIDTIRMEGVKAGRFLPLPGRKKEIKASPIVDAVVQIGPATLYLGDCTKIVPLLENMAACVTDPPYEIGFMGKKWDATGVAAAWATWAAVRIALKPGAHLVAFAGSRTYHGIATAIEDAGFEVRDQIMWIYGSGFPKSHDVSKAMDKRSGHWRGRAGNPKKGDDKRALGQHYERTDKGQAITNAARAWEGWGTALKPAHEPVCFARKPLGERTIVDNVLRWATGAINVAAGLVGSGEGRERTGEDSAERRYDAKGGTNFAMAPGVRGGGAEGRWPANVVHDGSFEVLEIFPPSARDAIRFFYAPKADRKEREFGMEGGDEQHLSHDGRQVEIENPYQRNKSVARNFHPTVKPVDLMRWLVRLVTPPDGVVLDPFMGSGSTGIAALREGFGFVGVEQSPEYFEIACRRIDAAHRLLQVTPDIVREAQQRKPVKARQEELL